MLTNLANAYGRAGDLERQQRMLEEVLRIKKQVFGAAHEQVGATLSGLGVVCAQRGNVEGQREHLNNELSSEWHLTTTSFEAICLHNRHIHGCCANTIMG